LQSSEMVDAAYYVRIWISVTPDEDGISGVSVGET